MDWPGGTTTLAGVLQRKYKETYLRQQAWYFQALGTLYEARFGPDRAAWPDIAPFPAFDSLHKAAGSLLFAWCVVLTACSLSRSLCVYVRAAPSVTFLTELWRKLAVGTKLRFAAQLAHHCRVLDPTQAAEASFADAFMRTLVHPVVKMDHTFHIAQVFIMCREQLNHCLPRRRLHAILRVGLALTSRSPPTGS